jgi:hypothetical protein
MLSFVLYLSLHRVLFQPEIILTPNMLLRGESCKPDAHEKHGHSQVHDTIIQSEGGG